MMLDGILYMAGILVVFNGLLAIGASPLGDKIIDWLAEMSRRI